MKGTPYQTPEDVVRVAKTAYGKTLGDFIPKEELELVRKKVLSYSTNRRGLLGDLVEQYVFGLDNNGRAEADFNIAGVELKTTPLKKHLKKHLVSKERLVFSMINYESVVSEVWESSSFLKKNRLLLIMFYLWLKESSVLEYEFKFIHFLDLLKGLSEADILQIQKDWEFIVNKIRRGEAHLLSEGDTFYLGACTKAANSRVVRDQPHSNIKAKPRAFSLKQSYLNHLVQTQLLKTNPDEVSLYSASPKNKTIAQVVQEKFAPYIGKSDKEISQLLNWHSKNNPKNYKRLLTNQILTGTGTNNIEELDKANVTLRVLTLEATGTLKESISFPAFDFKDLVTEVWYDEDAEQMSDLYLQLEEKKFLFVIFQKQKGSDEVVLKKTLFWNFPVEDIGKAQEVWEKTIELLNEGKIVKEIKTQKDGTPRVLTHFPGASYNGIIHVRPHGADSKDVNDLPVPDEKTGRTAHTKQAFWLNATYIQQAIESSKDQY